MGAVVVVSMAAAADFVPARCVARSAAAGDCRCVVRSAAVAAGRRAGTNSAGSVWVPSKAHSGAVFGRAVVRLKTVVPGRSDHPAAVGGAGSLAARGDVAAGRGVVRLRAARTGGSSLAGSGSVSARYLVRSAWVVDTGVVRLRAVGPERDGNHGTVVAVWSRFLRSGVAHRCSGVHGTAAHYVWPGVSPPRNVLCCVVVIVSPRAVCV